MLVEGDYATIVTKNCNSFEGSLIEIKFFGNKEFTYSYVHGPGLLLDELEVFNLDYDNNESWEKEATITKANNFFCLEASFMAGIENREFKIVDVRPRPRQGYKSLSSKEPFFNVHLLAENETHFQIYQSFSRNGEKPREPLLILAKRDYRYFYDEGVDSCVS